MSSIAGEDAEISGATLVVGAGVVAITFAFVFGMASPFVAGKEALVALVASFTLVLVVTDGRRRWPQWPAWWWALPAMAVTVAVVSAAVNGSDLLASDGVTRLVLYATFLVALRFACADAPAADWLAGVIVATAAAEAVLVVAQVMLAPLWLDSSGLPSDKWKAFGTLGNPNWTGGYLAIALPIALWRAVRRGTALPAFAVLSIAAALGLTLSRGAWVAGAAGTSLIICAGAARHRRRALVLAVSGFVAGVGIAYGSYGSDGVLVDVGRRGSIDGRLRMWQVSALMIADRPVLGLGVGRFAAAYPDYQRELLRTHDLGPLTDVTDHPHNEYLYIAAEAGAAGVAVALVGIALLARMGLRSAARPRLLPWAAGLAAVAVHAAVDVPLHLPVNAALSCVLLAGFVATAKEAPRRRTLSAAPRVLLAMTASLLLLQGVRLVIVDGAVRAARNALATGEVDAALERAKAGLRFDRSSGVLLTVLAQAQAAGRREEALATARRAAAARPSVTISNLIARLEIEDGNLQAAENELRALSETMPGLLGPRLQLADVYLSLGKTQRAAEELRRCLTIRPKVPTAEHRRLVEQARIRLERLEAGDAGR